MIPGPWSPHGLPAAPLAALCVLLATACPCQAQYPERPIRLILPFPAGGAVDHVARLVTARMAEELGRPFVIENKSGAGGIIATDATAKAAADGYTLLLTTPNHTINAALSSKLPYDTEKDLAPVSIVAEVPELLVSHPAAPFADFAGFVAYARNNPGKLNYSSAGNGTLPHVTMELLLRRTGITVAHIPYRGAAPAMTDLLAGQVQLKMDTYATAHQHVAQGKLRALAFASLIVLAILGLSPIGNALIIPLEERFPRWDATRGAPDGIIVLGGVISPDVSSARDEVALNEAAERLTVVAELARRYPDARIVFSGGSGALIYDEGAEAPLALRLLESFGIPRTRITLEDRSRNTVENAVLSKAIAQPKPGERWLLVTSAHHLPRAVGVFRKAGFPVEAYPVDWRTRGPEDALRPFASVGDGLRRSDTAVREWVGLAVYWLTGRSSQLFPAPTHDGH